MGEYIGHAVVVTMEVVLIVVWWYWLIDDTDRRSEVMGSCYEEGC